MTASKKRIVIAVALCLIFGSSVASAADRLVGIHSARVLSQAVPWVAQEAGLFKKYNLDFPLVLVTSSPAVTAAMLGGDGEIAVTGGEGNIRAYVQGATDFVFIGAVKNVFTHSIMAKADIKKPEDLKGKKIGINRIGSNPHFFAVQALRQMGLDPIKDVQLIQSGGSPETLAALVAGALDAASLNPPSDTLAISHGFHYLVYGPDQRIPYTATAFVTLKPVLARRGEVVGRFMHAMAEAEKILIADKEFSYKVLGKFLRVTDRKILDASYNTEIKAVEPKLEIRPEGIQSILDEVAKIDPRARKVKAADLIDRRYLDEMEKSGFFDKLWEARK